MPIPTNIFKIITKWLLNSNICNKNLTIRRVCWICMNRNSIDLTHLYWNHLISSIHIKSQCDTTIKKLISSIVIWVVIQWYITRKFIQSYAWNTNFRYYSYVTLSRNLNISTNVLSRRRFSTNWLLLVRTKMCWLTIFYRYFSLPHTHSTITELLWWSKCSCVNYGQRY